MVILKLLTINLFNFILHFSLYLFTDMDKKTIIDIIINHKPYQRYCNKLSIYTGLSDDLYQEFFLFMYEKPDAELVKIYNTGRLENYCLAVIYNKSRHINTKKKIKGVDNPLLQIRSFMVDINSVGNIEDNGYNHSVDDNYEKVMDYVKSDQSITLEDFLILTESMDGSDLIKLSKESGIPYITLKTKRKRIKDKIKQNVSI